MLSYFWLAIRILAMIGYTHVVLLLIGYTYLILIGCTHVVLLPIGYAAYILVFDAIKGNIRLSSPLSITVSVGEYWTP